MGEGERRTLNSYWRMPIKDQLKKEREMKKFKTPVSMYGDCCRNYYVKVDQYTLNIYSLLNGTIEGSKFSSNNVFICKISSFWLNRRWFINVS